MARGSAFSLRAAGWLAAALLAAALSGCGRAPEAVQVRFIAEGKPAKLSDWGVLRIADGKLRLNEGVEPYELNTPLFTDYAHKLRTIWMPKGTSARYDERETFDFPVGTVISKTFYYPKGEGGTLRQTYDQGSGLAAGALDLARVRLVETRLLVRREDGWIALPYVWNDKQTEAELMRTGEQMPLQLVADDGKRQGFTYVVPNENQCASCHVTQLKTKAFQPIGPKARHLNLQARYGERSENQLEHLQRVGYLSGLPAGAMADSLPRAANWQDTQQPLEARARAYLDINCAHCHSAKGSANNTALNLEPFLPPSHKLGLCKPTVAAGKGTGDRLFGIVPGQPDASIMPFRMASTEGGVMMPELGRSTVHAEGVALIRDWIAAMSGSCNTSGASTQ